MMTRKQFLQSLAGAVGASVLVGCGNDRGTSKPDAAAGPIDAEECVTGAQGRCTEPLDAGVDASAPVTCSTTSAVVGDNHGHALEVSDADVTAGVEKTYDIRGASGHPHAVTITVAMFAKLKQHMAITVTSTEVADHVHDVTVTCAAI